MNFHSDHKLENFSLLEGLDHDQREIFKSKLDEIHFKEGEEVFHEGDKGGAIFFLLSGEVEISQSLTLTMSKSKTSEYDSREKSLVSLTGDDGAVFGEVSMFGKESLRTATVKATTDCHMGTMTGDVFFQILEDHIEVGYRVMKNLTTIVCGRLVTANRNVLKLTTALSLVLEK